MQHKAQEPAQEPMAKDLVAVIPPTPSKWRSRFKILLYSAILSVVAVVAVYACLLLYPGRLFQWRVSQRNLTLCSDTPFDAKDGRVLLQKVGARIATSPLYKGTGDYGIFICNTGWRRRLFFLTRPAAGGLHYIGNTVFLSGGSIKDNQLRSPSGVIIKDERTLAYFISHEITHSLSEAAVGIWRFHRLPDWIKEGYADYVGRGGVLNRPGMREAYLANAKIMTRPVFAPYLRYNLLVDYCLETLGMTPLRLHSCGRKQDEIEAQAKIAFGEKKG